MLSSSCAALAGLLLAVAPAAGAQSPGASPRAAGGDDVPRLTFTGKRFPPPGSAEDQALLRSLVQAQARMLSERAIAIKLNQQMGTARHDERLAELARQGAPGAGELRARLAAAWSEDHALLTRQWPVSPRYGCRSQGIQLETMMGATDGAAVANLPRARRSAKTCLDKQLVALEPLQAANRKLRAAIVEADATLGAGSRADASATSPAAAPASTSAEPGSPAPRP